MMIIQKKAGTLNNFIVGNRSIDLLLIEWFETGKRILHKRTQSGKEIVLKFLKESPNLMQDDVLYEDEACLIVVDILPCEVIAVRPTTMYEMACLCYEIGNKHLPLYFQEEELFVPFDPPLFRLLQAMNYQPRQENRKLLQPLKTTVLPHAHTTGSQTLFSKILKRTTTLNGQ